VQQQNAEIYMNLVRRNTAWLATGYRCSLLQSFVQMPGDDIPDASEFQELYKHFARSIILGVANDAEASQHYEMYNYLFFEGNVDQVWEEDPIPDLTREDFEWVRAMLTEGEEQDGVDEIPNDWIQEPRRQTVRIQVKAGIECSVCLEEVNNERCVSLQCDHTFCVYCVKRLMQDRNKVAKCPMCRAEIETIEVNHDWVADELQA